MPLPPTPTSFPLVTFAPLIWRGDGTAEVMGAAGGGGTHAADGCYPGGWGAKGEQMDNTTASAFFYGCGASRRTGGERRHACPPYGCTGRGGAWKAGGRACQAGRVACPVGRAGGRQGGPATRAGPTRGRTPRGWSSPTGVSEGCHPGSSPGYCFLVSSMGGGVRGGDEAGARPRGRVAWLFPRQCRGGALGSIADSVTRLVGGGAHPLLVGGCCRWPGRPGGGAVGGSGYHYRGHPGLLEGVCAVGCRLSSTRLFLCK